MDSLKVPESRIDYKKKSKKVDYDDDAMIPFKPVEEDEEITEKFRHQIFKLLNQTKAAKDKKATEPMSAMNVLQKGFKKVLKLKARKDSSDSEDDTELTWYSFEQKLREVITLMVEPIKDKILSVARQTNETYVEC